jgi:hypothetical protein
MRGGEQWKEGSDTCVFRPSVACLEDPIKYPSGMPDMISRIVPKTGKDLLFEVNINKFFSQLIKRGIVAASHVQCTPKYKDTNMRKGARISATGPCSTLGAPSTSVNLITSAYEDSYYSHIKKNRIQYKRALELLRGAICAAVALVPDDGVWVVHGDLHLGNVFVKEDRSSKTRYSQTYTAIGDWGRTMLFDSKDKTSVFGGLNLYLKIQSENFGPFYSFQELAAHPGIAAGNYPQFSTTVLSALNKFHNAYRYGGGTVFPTQLTEVLNILRGYMVYTLLKLLHLEFKKPYLPWFSTLLNTTSQANLIQIINTNLPKVGGEDYYSERFVNDESISFPNEAPLQPANILTDEANYSNVKIPSVKISNANLTTASGNVLNGGRRKTRSKKRNQTRRKRV